MQTVSWPIPAELEKTARENYRTAYALRLKSRSAVDIVRELTFDGASPHIEVSDIENLLSFVERHFLNRPFSGTGIEVGAGPLVFSALLARRSSVDCMYGVEICRPIIEQLFPVVASGIAYSDAKKLVGAIGSFDDMRLDDASIDFVFDFFSLHHSDDISVTFKEIARVLRPGGFLLMLDKARPDSYTDGDLDELMDAPCGPELYRRFGFDPARALTRRQNGEREYRRYDWHQACLGAGFARFEHWHLARPTGSSRTASAKRLMSKLPLVTQRFLTRLLPSPSARHKFVLEPSDRVFISPLEPFHKEMSLMIAYR